MTYNPTPQRETYPFLMEDDVLVSVFRDVPLASRKAIMRLKGLTDSTYRVQASTDLDERLRYQVLDYTAGGGETLTITVNGTAEVLTEAVDFAATTSNEGTARAIALAINANATLAAAGITAESYGDVVLLAADESKVNSLVLATSNAAAWEPSGDYGTFASLVNQGLGEFEFPTSGLYRVFFLKLGPNSRVSADIRSPVEVRTYLRQPDDNRGRTGDPGGGPTVIDPTLIVT